MSSESTREDTKQTGFFDRIFGGGGGGDDKGCSFQTTRTRNCSLNSEGRLVCNTIERVFKKCPGRKAVEVSRNVIENEEAEPLADESFSGGAFGSEGAFIFNPFQIMEEMNRIFSQEGFPDRDPRFRQRRSSYDGSTAQSGWEEFGTPPAFNSNTTLSKPTDHSKPAFEGEDWFKEYADEDNNDR